MLALPFPAFDPVALDLGVFEIRWYALAYLAGFILGWAYAVRLARQSGIRPWPGELGDFLTWAVIGVIVGGRLGYVLFYNLPTYLDDPLGIFRTWDGGMSFHGGLVGVILAIWFHTRRKGYPPLQLADVVATVTPIGLLLGRIANFVNAELWGRPTDLPWAVVFPIPDRLEETFPEVGRHPSQLYEAFLEGAVLLVLLSLMARRPGIRRRPGLLTGTFLAGYGISRYLVEFVRQPDPQVGYLLWGTTTMGQLLSLPMIAIGIWLILRARSRPAVAEDPEPQA